MSRRSRLHRLLPGGVLAILLAVSGLGSRAIASDASVPGGEGASSPEAPELALVPRGPGDSVPLPLKSAGSSEVLREARSRGYLTLQDCFDIAVRENERIGRAQEDYTQAGLVKMQARGTILPQVTFEDNYYRQEKIPPPPGTNCNTASSTCADSRNQVLLHLQQPLFNGFREINFFKYANANIDSFAHALDNSRRLLFASVAQVFYLVLQLEGEVKALEDTVVVEEQRFREIQARHEAGLARKTEVLLVQSQFARDQSLLTSTRNDLQVARERLTFLLTVPVDLPLREEPAVSAEVPSDPGNGDVGAELIPLVRTARENRSDLKQMESIVEAAEHQVAVARGQYLPSITLDAYGYVDRTNYSPFAQQTDWSAQVDFTFPVFDGGRIRSSILTARSQLQQAILARDELARQVELEVQAAYLTLQSDKAQLSTLEVSVTSADENYRLVKEEYRSGLATNLEVFAAQNQLLSARLDLERQKYQVGLDVVALSLFQGLLPRGTASTPPPPSPPDVPGEGQGPATP